MTQELSIINRVQEVATKSGTAFELDLTVVSNLSIRAKAITSVSDEGFEDIKREMQKARKYTNDYFLNARSTFNALAKGVIEVEKIVLAEFVPEENRLIEMSKAEKERVTKEARLAGLPAKQERIAGAGISLIDDEVLALTDVDFELVFAHKVSEKALADAEVSRLKAEEALREIAEAQAKLDREKKEAEEATTRRAKEETDRDARLAQEEVNRVQRLADEETARLARLAQEEEARLAKIDADRIAVEQAETARLADKHYKKWLKDNKYNETTDIIKDNVLYRKISTYAK